MKKLLFFLAFLAPAFLFSQNIKNFDIPNKMLMLELTDSLIVTDLATSNITVATFTPTGKFAALETSDIGDITVADLTVTDLNVGDTIEYDNGAKIYNTETDTLFLTETVVKVEGNLTVTGTTDALHVAGLTYLSTAGIQTIATGLTFEVLYEGNMAYTGDHLNNFTESNGRLTYTGTPTINATINCNLTAQSGEAAQVLQFRLAENGTTIAGTNTTCTYVSQTVDRSAGMNWLLELATNDYIEVFGTSDTNGDVFTIVNLTLSIVKH